jgi:hypothetical protein
MPAQQQRGAPVGCGCVGVALVLVVVACVVGFLWSMAQEPPDITGPPPPPSVGTAEACATGSPFDCSAACGELSSRIRWNFDDPERRAWEQQYWLHCGQFGPPYETLPPPSR